MEALGRLFDIAPAVVPANLCAGNITGHRVSIKRAGAVTFVVFAAVGTAGDDLAVDLREHTAASGGTSYDLDIIDHYYLKSAVTLANGTDEWSEVTQTAASEIADAGGAGTSAEEQNLLVIEVRADQLRSTCSYISLDIPDLGAAGTKYGGAIAILHSLFAERAPTALGTAL